jgi:hypothetical protein
MGFGKTLTMISLIASDKEAGEMADIYMDDSDTRKPDIAATLVVIPPPRKQYLLSIIRLVYLTSMSIVIGTWEEQLLE